MSVNASLQTPQFPSFSARLEVQAGKAVTFFEPARGTSFSLATTLAWRPTDRVRTELRYTHAQLTRERDGSRLSTADIPRVKVEYQLARTVFVRVVGQYDAQWRDALRDPGTDAPILLRNPSTGTYDRSTRERTNDLRMDWLFSYRPTPGTVVFAGYGSSLSEPDAFSFRDIRRVNDGFFLKLSYRFRL